MFWYIAMYFSVITSVNDTLPNAGIPTAVRTASTLTTAPAESPVMYFASARMSWFSAHVTIGWRNANCRRTLVLMTDGTLSLGTATLFWSTPMNGPLALASKYAARRGSLRVLRIWINTFPATRSRRLQ